MAEPVPGRQVGSHALNSTTHGPSSCRCVDAIPCWSAPLYSRRITPLTHSSSAGNPPASMKVTSQHADSLVVCQQPSCILVYRQLLLPSPLLLLPVHAAHTIASSNPPAAIGGTVQTNPTLCEGVSTLMNDSQASPPIRGVYILRSGTIPRQKEGRDTGYGDQSPERGTRRTSLWSADVNDCLCDALPPRMKKAPGQSRGLLRLDQRMLFGGTMIGGRSMQCPLAYNSFRDEVDHHAKRTSILQQPDSSHAPAPQVVPTVPQ
jgi:hypothetical protein